MKVSKIEEDWIEVLGEFSDIEIAQKFAECIQNDDGGSRYEYMVEPPYRASSLELTGDPQ